MMMWDVYSFGLNGSNSGCVFQRITSTDSDGNYAIPDVSKGFDISRRSDGGAWGLVTTGSANTVDYGWRMLVYKAGYISTEDALRLQSHPSPTATIFTFSSNANFFPKVLSAGPVVQVAPITMTNALLTPEQEIVYLFGLNRAARCRIDRPGVDQPPEVTQLYSDVVQRVHDLPCRVPSSTELNEEVVKDYVYLVREQDLIQRMTDAGVWGIPWRPVEAGVLCGVGPSDSSR
jgi:hypothetical protein